METVIPQRPSYPLATVLGCLLSFSAMAQELPGTAAFKGLDKNGDGKVRARNSPARCSSRWTRTAMGS